MKVLVVDDSEYMRSQLRIAIEEAGFTVVGEAKSGEEAIDKAFELTPNVITLDYILPDMVGTQVLKVLKQKEKIDAHIIIVSGIAQESAINQGYELGAADYIIKPFTTKKIIDSINNVISENAQKD